MQNDVVSAATAVLSSVEATEGHVCDHGLYRPRVLQVSGLLEPKFGS